MTDARQVQASTVLRSAPSDDLHQDDLTAERPAEMLEMLIQIAESQARLADEQGRLRADFERVAGAVSPLLTAQFEQAQSRTRALELRLRARQERPLLVLMANLRSDVSRLADAADVRAHVAETIDDALRRWGYETFGAIGDRYDPALHEPVGGTGGTDPVVATVHAPGLACHGDVLIKAKVDVRPDERHLQEGAEAHGG